MKCAMEAWTPETVQSLPEVTGDGVVSFQPRRQRTDDGDVRADAGLASDNFLTLPAWFPADKASAVLRKKGKRFALVGDRNGTELVADLHCLSSAPPTKSVSWCASPLGPGVAPTATLDQVACLMDARGSAYLPVVVGGLIVGIVARDAEAMQTSNPASSRQCP